MSSLVFTKNIPDDFPIGPGCWTELLQHELNNGISGKSCVVTKNASTVTITWNVSLNESEVAIQDTVIAAHTTKLPPQISELRSGLPVASRSESYFSACDLSGGITLRTTWTDITFDTQKFIDTTNFTHTEGTAEVTVNTTGAYEIHADVTIDQPGSGSRSEAAIRLVKNGTAISGTRSLIYSRTNAQGGGGASVRIVESLTSGDVIKVQGIEVSGGTLVTYPEGCRMLLKKINV